MSNTPKLQDNLQMKMLLASHRIDAAIRNSCKAKAAELWHAITRRYRPQPELEERFISDETADFMRTMTLKEKFDLIRRLTGLGSGRSGKRRSFLF